LYGRIDYQGSKRKVDNIREYGNFDRRILGVTRKGNIWLVPANANKLERKLKSE